MKIISYDKMSGTLIVDFPGDLVNDRVHEFYDIPPHIYASLEAASDPSGYFNENIWGNKCEKKTHWGNLQDLLKYIEEHMFYETNVNINTTQPDGDTLLHIAAIWGDTEAIKLLIENGANVNAKGDMGCTPLYEAISFGHGRCAKMLLDAGADINDTNEFGTSSLKLAKTDGNDRLRKIIEKYV
jgi:hypothetical protein